MNTEITNQMTQEIQKKLLRDEVYRGYNQKIAEVYNMAVPYCVKTEDGECYLDYKGEVKELVKKIENKRLAHVEQNYPELITPF
jgi:hypothetical protein